ncbi:hypothetical protein AX16_009025 [Volvariella volvacea WC 439]|nr:hypothetical protein AX16_009025 [Volvariella volvacea WC 439]
MILSYLLAPVLLAATVFARPPGAPPYRCTDRVLEVPIDADVPILNFEVPTNNMEVVELLIKFANVTQAVVQGESRLTATYSIWTSLCLPNNYQNGGDVELAVHGIGADHSYWDFGGPWSTRYRDFNYVAHATSQGRAVLLYDRLGVGKSEKPEGLSETQIAVNVEVAAYLVNWLRQGVEGATFSKVLGHGHSNGSLQLLNLVAKFGNIVDGLILTGFTPFTGKLAATLAAMGFTLANQVGRFEHAEYNAFRQLPSNYLLNEGRWGYQMVFFSYPEFHTDVLEKAYNSRATVTAGELLTQYGSLAIGYTNPVLVVTGTPDFIFCENGCYAPADGFANVVDSTQELFPDVASFTTYIPPNTGHSPNLHKNAPQTFAAITSWISQL